MTKTKQKSSPPVPQDFASMRISLFDDALLWVSLATIPAVAISLSRALIIGWKPLMALHLVLLGLLWATWLARKRIPYLFRVVILLAALCFAAIAGLAQFGPLAIAATYVLLSVFVGILFLGPATAKWLIAINTLSLILIAWAASQYWLKFDLDYQAYAHHPLAWLNVTVGVIPYSVILALIVWRMIQNLLARESMAQDLINRQNKIAANLPGVIYQFLLRKDGTYCFPYASEGMQRFFNVDPATVTEDGSAIIARIVPEDIEKVWHSKETSIRDKASANAVFRVQHPQDGLLWLEYTSTPEFLPNGDILWHGFIKNVSERKRIENSLKQSEEKFRSLFELSQVGIAHCDFATGQFLDVNSAFLAPTGYSREEILSLTYYDITPKKYLPLQDGALYKMLETDHFGPFEKEYIRKDGSLYPVLLNGFKMTDPSGRLVTWAIIQDISEWKRAEQLMEQAKVSAESASHAKSEFLTNMSHELRTPLNAIIGFAQLLAMGELTPLIGEQKTAVKHIMDSGRHLLQLINEILDLVRIESGKIEINTDTVELSPLILETVSLSEPAASTKEVTIWHACPNDFYVYADTSRLRQILLNLLSNAIKYNKQQGKVTVSCHLENNTVRITIADTGFGITDEHHHAIFQPFQRLGAERSNIEGTGIGLTVCKRLIEAMNGRIGFDSTEGLGSCFWIELPHAEHTPILAASTIGETKSNIVDRGDGILGWVLYIEDNPVNVNVMKHVFRKLPGIELLVAESAEIGMEFIYKNKPDLILMDMNLPGLSGLESLKILKANPLTSSIPVIAISAVAMPDNIAEGMSAGLEAYLTKPFDVAELLDLLGKTLRKQQAHIGTSEQTKES
jgi:PAS domain S-box-containing protein